MKNKIVILLLSVFSVARFGFAASVNVEPPLMKISFDRSFTSLEVEDNIAVVLTNETGNEISLAGDKEYVKRVRAAVKRGRLYIWLTGSEKGERVTVYVPAALLRQVVINGDSYVSTASTLNNAGMLVVVNGACKLFIKSRGRIDISGTSEYEFRGA
jgi:hypothetical protein